MYKRLEFFPNTENGVDMELIHPGVLEKTAEMSDELQAFIKELHPKKGKLYILVNALGASEYYGANRNGDAIAEKVLKKFHKTFELNGKVYKHHKNKDPRKALGKVLFSHYNDNMHRVELVCEIDSNKADRFVEAIKQGKYPPVSMGMRTKFDICSLCGHRSKSFTEYCVLPDTLISLSDGRVKEISKITEGEEVLSADGKPTKVIKVFRREVDEELLEIKHTLNGFGLKVTYNHPILISLREDNVCYYRNSKKCFKNCFDACRDCKKTLSTKDYMEAGDLRVGDYVFSPSLAFDYENSTELTEDLAWALGLFVAEGCYGKNSKGEKRSVQFCLNQDEKEIIEKLDNILKQYFPEADLKIYNVKNSKALSCRLHNREACKFFDKYVQEYAHHKAFKGRDLLTDRSLLESYIFGLWDGDGFCGPKGDRLNSSSLDLVCQTSLYLNTLGLTNFFSIALTPGGPSYRNNVFIQYYLNTMLFKRPRNLHRAIEDGMGKGVIKEIKPFHYTGLVYNLETEDGSYIANGIIVHNCDHLKYHMNEVYPDGRKVYAINPEAKFFDISFVVIPADPTAGVMRKLASAPRPKSGAQLGEEFLHAASLKEADIVKRIVDETAEVEFIQKDPHGRILLSQKPIPKKDLKSMVKEASLGEILSTFMGMRIMPTPVDFQRLVLYSRGQEKLAECLDKHKILLIDVNKNTKPLIPEDLSLANFNSKLAKKYAYLIPSRALTKPLVSARILEKIAFNMNETPMEQAGIVPPKKSDLDAEEHEFYLRKEPSYIRKVFLGVNEEPKILPYKNPLLASSILSSLFFGLQKSMNLLGQEVGQFDAFLLRRPWLIPLLIGAGSLGSIGIQKTFHQLNSKEKQLGLPKLGAAGIENILARYLIAVPVSYLYSGLQESKVRRGESIGPIQNLARKHPVVLSILGGWGLGKLQRAMLKYSSHNLASRSAGFLKALSSFSDEKLNTLFNDIVNM
jgi:hypothetical protein